MKGLDSVDKIDIETLVKTILGAAAGNGLPIPGTLQGKFAENRAKAPIIFITASPRSGSTFLLNALHQLSGLPFARLSSAYSTNEHDLYLPALSIVNNQGCVSRSHMKGTFHNASLLSIFGIQPIILVRDIFDSMVSLHADLRKKEKLADFGTGANGYSFIWQDRALQHSNDQKLMDAIIDLALPWYVNFYVSWHRLCEQKRVTAMWVTYEQLMADKERTIQEIFQFLGLKPPTELPAELMQRRYDTFRDGRSGAGKGQLTLEQCNRIQSMFSYYPDINFSKYGINT